MLSAERLERILGCPCGWRGGPVTCEAPTRYGANPAVFPLVRGRGLALRVCYTTLGMSILRHLS
jgi:hypothetical protein